MASNQVDTFGKQLLTEEPDYIYKYKGLVKVGLLGMVDDLAGVGESGVKATQLNAFINVKTAEKKLQFGPDTCHTLSIAHKKIKHIDPNLYIDYWSESHSKEDILIDRFEGKIKMKNVSEQKYLGFVISQDGSNLKEHSIKKEPMNRNKEDNNVSYRRTREVYIRMWNDLF